MPVYEYRCCNCDATFEMLVRAGATVTCPHCGSPSLDNLVSLTGNAKRVQWTAVQWETT